ncbi:MAG TPA: hypothetical protein ENJ64_00375, partial [Thiotrichales bacterium]|nr:hypothetical protein [Thiotrichales bacterium]
MDSPLLQRIVGAVVLVALGVIFIPALLDGSGYHARQMRQIEIKPKPTFPPLSQKHVAPIISPVQKTRQQLAAKKEKQPAQPDKRARPDRAGKPIRAFALQVGTFQNNANAEKLRDKLRKAGYASFVVPVVEKDKKIYKVRIGPELEKAQLLKIN